MIGTSLHTSLRRRAGVEADGGGRGEVEALGVAVDGDSYGVEAGAHLIREAVGFAAEDPGGGDGQVGGVEFVMSVPVRGHQLKAHRTASVEHTVDFTRSSDGEVEDAAGGGADALAVVRIHGVSGEDHGVGTGGVGDPGDGAGVARI